MSYARTCTALRYTSISSTLSQARKFFEKELEHVSHGCNRVDKSQSLYGFWRKLNGLHVGNYSEDSPRMSGFTSDVESVPLGSDGKTGGNSFSSRAFMSRFFFASYGEIDGKHFTRDKEGAVLAKVR